MQLSLDYKFAKKGYNTLDIQSKIDLYNSNSLWSQYQSIASNYTYSRHRGISYAPNEYKNLYLFLESDYSLMAGVGYSLDYISRVANGVFINLGSNSRVNSNSSIYIGSNMAKSTIAHDSDIYYNSKNIYSANYAVDVSAGVKKVFDVSWYNYTFPLSIRRGAINLKSKQLFSDVIIQNETSLGVEFEILAGHNSAMSFEGKVYKNSTQDNVGFGFDIVSRF